MLAMALIFSAYVSLAQACEELIDDAHCKCYLTVKVPKHELTLGKEQNANDPILFVKNETAKPVAIVFTKGSEIVREICVKPCAEETVIMDAGKFKYKITGWAACKTPVKGSQTFVKGNNYNWVINTKVAGYNTITKQIGECAPCVPVCKPEPVKPLCKEIKVCAPNCMDVCCKPACPPPAECIPVIKVKPVAAPVVSEPIEVKPVVCAPVCKPVCKPVCDEHKHIRKHYNAKYMDCADQTNKFFNHKPCLMNLAPVKPAEVPKAEEKPAEAVVENAYIEMINASNECVTYLVSGPGVSKKVNLEPCRSVALEVLPGKYAVVASVNGILSPMQSLTVAAGQKVEVKY